MRKSFLINIAFLVVLNLIVKPFWILGIDRSVQNTVGHAQYGLYQALFNATIIFQILLDFGLNAFTAKKLGEDAENKNLLFPNIIVLKGSLSILYLAMMFGYGSLIQLDSSAMLLLMGLTSMQIAGSFLAFFRSTIGGLQYFKTDSLFSVIDRFIAIIVLSLALFIFHDQWAFSIQDYAWVQAIAYGLTAAIALIFCLRKINWSWNHIHLEAYKTLLKQSVPYAVLVFLMSVYMRVDMIILSLWGDSAAAVGKYAAAYRLLDVANNMSGVLIAGILLPLFSKMIAAKEDFKSILNLCLNTFIPISVSLSIIGSFYAPEIMSLLYRDTNASDAILLSTLLCAFPIFSLNYLFSTLLTADGQIKTLLKSTIIATLFNFTFNVIAIHWYAENAVWGAALLTVITQFLVFLFNFNNSNRLLNTKLPRLWVLKIALFITTLCILCYVFPNHSMAFYFQMAILFVLSIILIILIGILPIKTLKEKVKNIYQSIKL